MKIKRFFAQDMRQAIRKVERELGPDAVILSNKKVIGGVEIVAAMDFDHSAVSKELANQAAAPKQPAAAAPEIPAVASPVSKPPRAAAARHDENFWTQEPTMVQIRRELNDLRGLLERQLSGFAWGDEARRHPVRAQILRDLVQLGLTPEHARGIVDTIPDDLGPQRGWLRALETLAAEVPALDADLTERGGIVALVGPTGVGKTTTIAKLAARYVLRNGKKRLALVTVDNFRIGAHEQLRTYGRILDVPVYTVKNAEELRGTLDDLVDRDLILIDTAGMSQRDPRLNEQIALLSSAQQGIRMHLVVSATTHQSGLREIVGVFKSHVLHGCIVTKVDEAAQLGGVLSMAAQHRLPVAYVSDGQRVPEDIHVARARDLVQRAVGILRGATPNPAGDESLERAFRGPAVNVNV
jgi:flagellar biosynthesis protein FlhF